MSVCTQSTPRRSNQSPSGQPKASPLNRPRFAGSAFSGTPPSAKMSQRKRVAATSSPSSRQRMMWPNRLFARGFAASGPGCLSRPRALLLVSVMYTSRVTGWTAPHSGRSIGVAPTRSADCRVFTSTSAWLANPFAAVSPFFPCTSASQSPVPSALNRAA